MMRPVAVKISQITETETMYNQKMGGKMTSPTTAHFPGTQHGSMDKIQAESV